MALLLDHALDLLSLPTRPRPRHRQVVDVSAPLHGLRPVEGRQDDAPLQLAMEGDPEMVTHHEGHEDRAWRPGMFRDVAGHRDRHRGDTPSFYGALHERDGLMSERSGRRQEGDVRPLGDHRLRDVLGQRPLQALRIHIVADEGDEVGREATDHALCRQFL